MRRVILAIVGWLFFAAVALAQNNIVPTAPSGTNNNQAASTEFVQGAIAVGPPGGKYTGRAYFGSGFPWVDVRSGTNGCAAATGNGSTDDGPAIQCQLDYLNTFFGGGIVYFPLGQYLTHQTLHVQHTTLLEGAGVVPASIQINTDITAINFDANTFYATLENLLVFGNQLSPTQNLVTVGNGGRVMFRNCVLNGGLWALQTGGVDGNVLDCGIAGGYAAGGGGVLSSGANTYYDAKIDNGSTVGGGTTAFKQVAYYSGGAAENRIVNSDMSGNYTNSLVIADTNNAAITSIQQTVFSSPVSITGAGYTMLSNIEFGSATFANAGKTTISGSSGLGVTVTPSGGAINCVGASNTNITCPGIPNANLANSATTVAGQTCTLGSTCGLSSIANSLGSPVNLTNVGYTDGPSVAQGTTGTWLATGEVALTGTGGDDIVCQIWDGTTTIAAGSVAISSAGNISLHLSGILASPAGNLRISCENTTGNRGTMATTNGVTAKASTISVTRIN